MSGDDWHHAFVPSSFVGSVQLDRLLEKLHVEEASIKARISPCVLCRSTTPPGLLLNNGDYLCSVCFEDLSRVSYPEKYERLRREYISSHEAWRLARTAYANAANERTERNMSEWTRARVAFSQQSPYSGIISFFWIAAAICLLAIIVFPPVGIIGAIAAGVVASISGSAESSRMMQWEADNPQPVSTKVNLSLHIPGWDDRNPEPVQPVLRHFHDPEAELSRRDRDIMYIFNHWPGYPPFWDYLKGVVTRRDGNRCQVTGCPSRVTIHVHHMQPTSQGGEHKPDNLVCLCAFHHGLEPESGHERVWGDIKNRYFTLVSAHVRANPGGSGEHNVCAHVRRLELVTQHELEEIAEFYGFKCAACGNPSLSFTVTESTRDVAANCTRCRASWNAHRALTEETGPRLAEILVVSRNKGRWRVNWEMFADRNHSIFRTSNIHRHRNGTIKTIESSNLPESSHQKAAKRKTPNNVPAQVVQSARQVKQNRLKTLNSETISYAHECRWITDWDYRFYNDIMCKRSLSSRQREFRTKINQKVLKRCNML